MTEHPTPRSGRRRGLLAGATLAALLAGGGVSVAAAAQGAPKQAPTTQQNDGQESGRAPGETPDASYTSSTTAREAPDGKEGSEANEATQEQAEASALAKLATVTPVQATEAATKAVPGKAAEPELHNEDGNVVYEVTVTSVDGKTQTDVVIDAGNATVLAQESEDGHEGNDAPEKAEPTGDEAPAPAPGVAPGN